METALNLPPLIASRYLPIRLIGKGGMGAVYEVEHARTGEHLALKVLLGGVGSSAQAVERFKREARASARIKSEYVVRVTDADVAPELEGAPFLVMELLEGMDLEEAATTSLPNPASVIAWLRQVAQAMDKAHALGIIHRDLKPENLFLVRGEGSRSVVKVLDFGIAKMLEEGTGVTGAGQMLGTPRYMSPEQATPNAPVTPATDRCALGLIAYRLLVGDSYYKGGAMGILGQILHVPLQPPSLRGSQLGESFDAWFLKACHRDPEGRFSSTSEQVEALASALALPRLDADGGGEVTLPGAALEAAPVDRQSEGLGSRRSAIMVGVIAAGLAAVALIGLLAHQSGGRGGTIARPAAAVQSQSPSPAVSSPGPSAATTPVSPGTSSSGEGPPLPPRVAAVPEAQVPLHPSPGSRVPRRRVAAPSPPTEGAISPGPALAPAPAAEPAPDPYAEQK